MRLMASGCKNLLESGIGGEFIFLGGSHSEQTVDDVVLGYAITFGREVHDKSMTQNRLGEGLDVIRRDMRSTVKQRASLAAQDQELYRSRASAPTDHILDEVRNAGASHTRLSDK
jgi:hypothetical protein